MVLKAKATATAAKDDPTSPKLCASTSSHFRAQLITFGRGHHPNPYTTARAHDVIATRHHTGLGLHSRPNCFLRAPRQEALLCDQIELHLSIMSEQLPDPPESSRPTTAGTSSDGISPPTIQAHHEGRESPFVTPKTYLQRPRTEPRNLTQLDRDQSRGLVSTLPHQIPRRRT